MAAKKKTKATIVPDPVDPKAIKDDTVVYKADKQYTIFYTIGSDPQFFVSHGTDYKLATIDIQSMHTGEIFVHPVVFVIDEPADTMDMIPFASVGNLKYNWGYREESEKFITDLKTIQKKAAKARKKRESSKLPSKVEDAMAPKENDYLHQYG